MKKERFIRIFIWFLLIVLWDICIYAFIKSPDIIPVHLNYSGKVDGYGSKVTFFVLPAIATLLILLFRFLIKHPELSFKYNIGRSKLTEENKAKLMKQSTALLYYYQILILVLFIFLTTIFYWLTIHPFTLGAWFVWVIMILFLVPAFYFTFNSLKLTRQIQK